MTQKHACELLQTDLNSFTPPPPRDDAACEAAAERMHMHARQVFRRKAKAAHPDAGGSHARMVELSDALEMVLSLSLRPQWPQPTVRICEPFESATATSRYATGSVMFTFEFVRGRRI